MKFHWMAPYFRVAAAQTTSRCISVRHHSCCLFWWRANLLDEKMAAASSISSTLDTAPMFARIGKSGEVLYQREAGDRAKQAQQVHARSRCSGLNESNCTSAGGSSRSHWRQAATVLPKPNVLAQQGQTVVVTVAHTDEDIWFRVIETPRYL